MPFWLASLGALLTSPLPAGLRPLTRDQVRMLRRDNVVSEAAEREGRTLQALGIDTPHAIEFCRAYISRAIQAQGPVLPLSGIAPWRALRVRAALRAEADLAAGLRLAAARPPSRPPLRAETLVSRSPRPDPLLLPPPLSLLTVAQARRSASRAGDAAILVAILDMLSFAFLLVGILRLAASGHVCSHGVDADNASDAKCSARRGEGTQGAPMGSSRCAPLLRWNRTTEDTFHSLPAQAPSCTE